MRLVTLGVGARASPRYAPAGLLVAHEGIRVIGKLFGADARSEIVDDPMRMKSFIETGHQPHDAAERQAAAAS